MLTIEFMPSFKRDYKRMMKKHYNEMEFRKVINLLVNQEQEVRSCVHYLKTVL